MVEELDGLSQAEWQARLAHVVTCARTAPPGALKEAKQISAYVNDASTAIMQGLLLGGLTASVGGPMAELQAAIYAYIRKSNADKSVFGTIEYFGEHIHGDGGPAMYRNVELAIKAFSPENLGVQVAVETPSVD